MKIYSMCSKPGGCCIEVAHDEENDVYRIFDDDAGWSSNDVMFEQLIDLLGILNQIKMERNDIKDLD